MPTVKLYVEGGGESNALRTTCRKGFAQFLEKAGLGGRMPRIVACGSRNDAYRSFCTAIKQNSNELSLLLVDSEATVISDAPWSHLQQRDNWTQPPEASNDIVHLMAQCMETWLIADADTLAAFFGNGFNRNNLPRRANLETVPKEEIYRALENATRHTSVGAYNKGKYSFELLARVDPAVVRNRCLYAERFVAFLLNTL